MRPAKINPARRCGYPERCDTKGIDHYTAPERRPWGYHDIQCQTPNPRPGSHLDGYPECGLVQDHDGDCDYRRHIAVPVNRDDQDMKEAA